jgi:hypothetical protein
MNKDVLAPGSTGYSHAAPNITFLSENRHEQSISKLVYSDVYDLIHLESLHRPDFEHFMSELEVSLPQGVRKLIVGGKVFPGGEASKDLDLMVTGINCQDLAKIMEHFEKSDGMVVDIIESQTLPGQGSVELTYASGFKAHLFSSKLWTEAGDNPNDVSEVLPLLLHGFVAVEYVPPGYELIESQSQAKQIVEQGGWVELPIPPMFTKEGVLRQRAFRQTLEYVFRIANCSYVLRAEDITELTRSISLWSHTYNFEEDPYYDQMFRLTYEKYLGKANYDVVHFWLRRLGIVHQLFPVSAALAHNWWDDSRPEVEQQTWYGYLRNHEPNSDALNQAFIVAMKHEFPDFIDHSLDAFGSDWPASIKKNAQLLSSLLNLRMNFEGNDIRIGDVIEEVESCDSRYYSGPS